MKIMCTLLAVVRSIGPTVVKSAGEVAVEISGAHGGEISGGILTLTCLFILQNVTKFYKIL